MAANSREHDNPHNCRHFLQSHQKFRIADGTLGLLLQQLKGTKFSCAVSFRQISILSAILLPNGASRGTRCHVLLSGEKTKRNENVYFYLLMSFSLQKKVYVGQNKFWGFESRECPTQQETNFMYVRSGEVGRGSGFFAWEADYFSQVSKRATP